MKNYDDTQNLLNTIILLSQRSTEVWNAGGHYPEGWGDFIANTADRLRTILARELLDLRMYTKEND